MGFEPWVVVLWWLVFFFPLGFLIGVVFCVIVKLDLFCFVVCVLLYIYICVCVCVSVCVFHCINLMIIETIQEVDAIGVHGSTL